MQEAPIQHQSPPLAIMAGQPFTDCPEDLYIPPEALRVFLEAFEGPLDLLLYLIKKQNINILDIPIAEITRQYMNYIDLMQVLHIELASEYLVMAAFLAEIKSRFLLPQPESDNEEGKDPRTELIERLQEYERYHKVALSIDALPRLERDFYLACAHMPTIIPSLKKPSICIEELYEALKEALTRAALFQAHKIASEPLSIRERMSIILTQVNSEQFTIFSHFFKKQEGSMGVTVTFIAILELVRQAALDYLQREPFTPIYVRCKVSLDGTNTT